ncbi:ATP-binding cassette domain-containing protein [Myxococcus sp. MxC21-1]|uniref:methionine ABC transporter ATP-binding protein n=1 Tax=Myxococcus sp. MxC21-1 TaxID=3041439 RepID=UPI00292F978D|nr:ATP-binding cassette domain-containing protein [Myxococcus sp. MxC21-1]WNZ63240.1 ATP-binding cassette domain-containing protein [Myxococcus sp. MxC21-1]
MIAFRGVSKVYTAGGREVAALRNVSLRVEAGEIHGVLGQSGAGKSTLIRCANLLERPTEGSVSVDGQDLLALSPEALRKARQGIGMIFQHFNLFGSKTVAANVAYPLEVAGASRQAIRERVEELLSLVGLSDKAQAYPSQLSGGQKQRVGIARALAPRPRVLLSDEATSALDPETTRSVLGLLRDINQKLGVTLLLITHQMDVVKAICDSASVLERGRLVEQGKVTELLAHPSTRLHQLCFPAFAPPTDAPSGLRVALTLAGEHARRPLLGTLARQFDVDALLVEGAMERVGNTRVGRLLVDLQGSADAVSQALAYLREQGLTLEEAAHG